MRLVRRRRVTAQRADGTAACHDDPVPGHRTGTATVGNQAWARSLTRSATATDGRPLEPRVRTLLEGAYGVDLSTVTVAERPRLAGTGTLAVTSGEHVALAPGAARDDRTRTRLVAHEVAHVVQQRQGRVPGRGLTVDDRWESEADRAAARAVRGEPTGTGAAPGTAEPRVTQPKLGFELESVNSFVAHDDIELVTEKQTAYREDGFTVEGDEGADPAHTHVEFVTTAVDDPAELLDIVGRAAALAQQIAGDADPAGLARPGPGGGWVRRVAIEVTDPTFRATVQGSVGITLDRIPELLRAVEEGLGGDVSPVLEAAKDLLPTPAAPGAPPVPVSDSLLGFLSIVAEYVAAVGVEPETRDRGWDPLTGLASRPRDWLRLPAHGDVEEQWWDLTTDGPKAWFAVMARTDFRAMARMLPVADRARLADALADPLARGWIGATLGRDLTAPLVPSPYRADRAVGVPPGYATAEGVDVDGTTFPVVLQGPTLGAWLDSIVAPVVGGSDKDLMSPPVGWGQVPADVVFRPTDRQIVDHHVYGMGAYRQDAASEPAKAVFEVRALQSLLSGSGVPTDAASWVKAAQVAITGYLAAGL